MENTAKLWLCKVTVFQLYTVNTKHKGSNVHGWYRKCSYSSINVYKSFMAGKAFWFELNVQTTIQCSTFSLCMWLLTFALFICSLHSYNTTEFKQNTQGGTQSNAFYAHTFLMYHNEQETYLMKYFQRSIFNYHLQST
jgi:hypothetical protein